VKPSQEHTICYPAHATGTGQWAGSRAIAGEIGRRISQNLDLVVWPQVHQASHRHLQHGHVTHVLVFGISIIQASGDNDPHLPTFGFVMRLHRGGEQKDGRASASLHDYIVSGFGQREAEEAPPCGIEWER
jgi:hypothetical protein